MKYTAKYANSSPSIHQSLPMQEDGYYFHCALDALLHQINLLNISDLSLEKDHQAMHHTVKKDSSVHSTMALVINLLLGWNFKPQNLKSH